MLLARDSKGGGVDIPMCGDPMIGYFSNFIDEKGYKMTFTIDTAEVRLVLDRDGQSMNIPDTQVHCQGTDSR